MNKIIICIYNNKSINEVKYYLDDMNIDKIKIDFHTGNIDDTLFPRGTCFLSPANSFGYMDGSIDETYSKMFRGIQNKILSI